MSEVRAEAGADLRRAARAGFAGLTVGRAPGFVQANLFLVPDEVAAEFEAFCHANPAACPLVGMGRAGDHLFAALGQDLDLRTDLPAYLVHEHGTARRCTDIRAVWRRDLVPFAVGCWFGAEAALAAAGIRLRHVERGIAGPLFRTNVPAAGVGRFSGDLVVSMRPFADRDVDRVAAITARLPLSHGAPLHRGDTAILGIVDASRPDWGEPLAPEPGEIALYWGCGLTALAALQGARLPFFITHAPGAMLVTDLEEARA